MAVSYTVEWKISNLSYCWLKKGEAIESPPFEVGASVKTKWSLLLYPRGIETKDHVGVYLRREQDVCGPIYIGINFKFVILDANNSCFEIRTGVRIFDRGRISGVKEFVSRDKIFGSNREKFLPQDILTLQCTVWIKDEMPFRTNHNKVLWTILELNCRKFIWKIYQFSSLRPDQKNSFVVMNESKKVLVSFHLVSIFRREINLEIMSCDESLKTFSFNISVVDSEGEEVSFGSHKFFADFEKIPKLVISREKLMENKSRYLPNDVLNLACEIIFPTGTILYACEEVNFGIIYPTVKKNFKETRAQNEPVLAQNEPQQILPLVKDLKSMYDETILCDFELRTSSRTFSAHKTILSARSPVFRRMFSSDMREKNSGHVDITDLDDDTVHRMLLYIYTDALEDLQFESASKLYSAADKYAILSLKERCSSFLKDNVTPTKACDLLVLADRHQDDDFKRAAQDYILGHDKAVFGSPEWKDFMANNLQLAADIMYRKVCPN